MQPIGVIYNTSMSRPDSALALAALYAFQASGESRIGSVCVAGAGLQAAIFCDIVGRFYRPGAGRNSNDVLPVGLADATPLPFDSPMLEPVLARDPPYAHNIRKLTDTAQAEAVLRNGVVYNTEAAVILSAPATCLANTLDLFRVQDLYRERVKRLVVVDSGAPWPDPPALRKILSAWPSPVFFCGNETGDSVLFPASAIEQAFAWTSANPVVEAYRAFRPMPYDAPTYDLAAAHFAVHPDSGFFDLSPPGSISVADSGAVTFTPGAGSVRGISVNPSRRDELVEAFIEIVSSKPPAPRRAQPPK